jgi:hypothetical protein
MWWGVGTPAEAGLWRLLGGSHAGARAVAFLRRVGDTVRSCLRLDRGGGRPHLDRESRVKRFHQRNDPTGGHHAGLRTSTPARGRHESLLT